MPPATPMRSRSACRRPARWDRRRLALQVPRAAVLYFDEFPQALPQVQRLLPRSARRAVARAAVPALRCRAACVARVYGSYGWQATQRARSRAAGAPTSTCLDRRRRTRRRRMRRRAAAVLRRDTAPAGRRTRLRRRRGGGLARMGRLARRPRAGACWSSGSTACAVARRRMLRGATRWRRWPHEPPRRRRTSLRAASRSRGSRPRRSAAPPRSRCTTSWRCRPSRDW